MNKQALIDKAVDDWGGIFKPGAPLVYWYEGKGTYAACIGSVIGNREVLFTETEFTQRAKELGWVSGYLWGKEYQTNGKKPDLLGDVEVEVDGHNSGQWLQPRRVKSNRWRMTNKFRIVDERYKPLEQQLGNSEQLDNSWHERGEFPPVGEWVEFDEYKNNNWRKVQIRGYWTENGNTSVWIQSVGKPNITKDKFRPIKTEFEKFQDSALELYDDNPQVWIHAMFRAGFRALDEKSSS